MKLIVLIGTLLIVSAYGEEGFEYEVDGRKFSLTPEKISQTIEKTKESLPFLEGDEETIKKVSFEFLLIEPGVKFLQDLSEIFKKSAIDLLNQINPPNKDEILIEITHLSETWKDQLNSVIRVGYGYKINIDQKEQEFKELDPELQEELKDFFGDMVKSLTKNAVKESVQALEKFKKVALDPAVKIIEKLNGAGVVKAEGVARKIVDYFVNALNHVN